MIGLLGKVLICKQMGMAMHECTSLLVNDKTFICVCLFGFQKPKAGPGENCACCSVCGCSPLEISWEKREAFALFRSENPLLLV